jgi:hypothetical protein
MDDHIVYAIVLLGFILAGAGRYLGFGKWWKGIGFVKGRRWLE